MKNLRIKTVCLFITGLLLFTVGMGCSHSPGDEWKDLGFYDLGYGYDVFDEYAKPDKVKVLPILDQQKLHDRGYTYSNQQETTDVDTIQGSTLSAYRENLKISAGVSGGFKGFTASVKTNYAESTYSSTSYSFATYKSHTLKRKIGVNPDVTIEEMRECLVPDAKEAIETAAATDLFHQYGTHVITAFLVGGTINFHMAADMSEYTSTESIETLVEAGYQSTAASLSVEANTSMYEEIEENSATTSMKLTVTGGNSAIGNAIAVDSDNSENYRQWADSLEDESTHQLFDFEGLIPIWELASTEERRNELENAFSTWASDRDAIEQSDPDPTTGTLTIWAHWLYNHNYDAEATQEEWLWKITGKVENNPAQVITENKTDRTDIDCNPTEYINFGDPKDNDEPNLANYTTETFRDVPRAEGTTIEITPALEETDGDDLGQPNTGNEVFCSETDGPHFTFELNNGAWIFKEKEGGCTATKKDAYESGAEAGDHQFILRENSGGSNDEYVKVLLKFIWE